jgi:hypothetical protein
MEEFLACSMYPLAANVGFDRVAISVTPISKLKMPLPKFVAAHKDDEDDVKFLARIELDAEGIMGSYTSPEHDACITGLRNGGHLYHMFELAWVAYRPSDSRMSPDLPRGTSKLIGADLDVDDEGSEQRRFEPVQSLHHNSVGYRTVHTRIGLTKKAIFLQANQEHKQEQERIISNCR